MCATRRTLLILLENAIIIQSVKNPEKLVPVASTYLQPIRKKGLFLESCAICAFLIVSRIEFDDAGKWTCSHFCVCPNLSALTSMGIKYILMGSCTRYLSTLAYEEHTHIAQWMCGWPSAFETKQYFRTGSYAARYSRSEPRWEWVCVYLNGTACHSWNRRETTIKLISMQNAVWADCRMGINIYIFDVVNAPPPRPPRMIVMSNFPLNLALLGDILIETRQCLAKNRIYTWISCTHTQTAHLHRSSQRRRSSASSHTTNRTSVFRFIRSSFPPHSLVPNQTNNAQWNRFAVAVGECVCVRYALNCPCTLYGCTRRLWVGEQVQNKHKTKILC